MDAEEELFIAVQLSHASAVRDILSQNPDLVFAQDDKGDQALHLAAKINDLDVGRILVEFDAPLGKRNYDALTPLGLARMHGHSEFVSMLKIHYAHAEEASAGGDESEKIFYKRINLESINSQRSLREEQKKKDLAEEIESWRNLTKHKAAISIQKMTRQRLANKVRDQLIFENICAIRIQSAWRWRYRDGLFRLRTRSAKQIQAFERMRVMRNQFVNFEYERLWLYRASRILACDVQRLWRGHRGRCNARREMEIYSLPDPKHVLNFDWWLSCQKESNPPARIWGIYCEYTLSGTPRSWYERNVIKRSNVYYRDVKFYTHSVNRRVSWDQPSMWQLKDRRDFEQRLAIEQLGFTPGQDKAARKLQESWRAKIARRHLTLLLKAERLMANSQSIFESDPENMAALCNYTLFVHVGLDDLDKASRLYKVCISQMMSRGGDNPFILYSYAIFAARMGENYLEFVKRAKAAEERLAKRETQNVPIYSLANAYIRHLAISAQSVASWHNYALCRAFVYTDNNGASTAFRKALSRDPNNAIILRNFNDCLQRHEPGCPEVSKYDVINFEE